MNEEEEEGERERKESGISQKLRAERREKRIVQNQTPNVKPKPIFAL